MAPLFTEADAPLIKTYIIARLESASEADPDVLSDYILALLRHDQTPSEVMSTCITQLADFMTSDPTTFVKDIFEAIATKRYLTREGKKRSFDNVSQNTGQGQGQGYPNKLPRQGQYPTSAPTTQNPLPQHPYPPFPVAQPLPIPPQQQQWPGVPPSRFAPWPGQGPPPPGWNATQPLVPGPVMSPQAPWPAIDPVPIVAPAPKRPRIKGTCYDYLEKGVCLRGANCPYDHGLAPAVISPTGEIEGADAYDPLNPNGTSQAAKSVIPAARPPVIGRFEIIRGPNYSDKSNTSLVVEGIPPEKLNDSSIRAYFSQFGPLTQILIDFLWKKALLVYTDHDSASRAWNDPRPVFNNRFVKIFWKRNEKSDAPNFNVQGFATAGRSDGYNGSLPSSDVYNGSFPSSEVYNDGNGGHAGSEGYASIGTGQELSEKVVDDVELEVAREAARKAQREHEEKVRRKEELERKKEELERQRVELMERQRKERERLMEKIRRAKETKEAKEEEGNNMESTTESPVETKETKVVAKEVEKVEEKIEEKDEVVNEDADANGESDKDYTEHETTEEKPIEETATTNGDSGGSSRKAQLQKLLSDLQNQAKALNIPPSEYTLPPLSNTTTRAKISRGAYQGGYRGRGTYPPRGRGRGRGGSSRSLDLRPKSILINGIVGTEKETLIREWVIMNCGVGTGVEVAGENGKGLVVVFRERYEAEEFLQKLLAPPLGPLSGTWYISPSTPQNDTNPSEVPLPEDNEQIDSLENTSMGKEYVYDEEEEGEVRESEGRWKR